MKALQRLLRIWMVIAHWAAFIWLVFVIGSTFYGFVFEDFASLPPWWMIVLSAGLPIAAFAFIPWIFTGKFILWPWNRSLPKQED